MLKKYFAREKVSLLCEKNILLEKNRLIQMQYQRSSKLDYLDLVRSIWARTSSQPRFGSWFV